MALSDRISKETLKKMYEEDLLTESQIAKEFGTTQVSIGRLRKKYGIPTIGKSRSGLGLPVLTREQREIVVGSLLGDGSVSDTSQRSSSFSEGHCVAQREYLEWKRDKLMPYSLKLRHGGKTVGGKFYPNVSFSTKSCPVFKEFRELFYPEGRKVFPASLKNLMTPLVLAIWYMDDGSLESKYYPRITFGLCDQSLKRALVSLRSLGLSPKVYHFSNRQQKTIRFPGQNDLFFSIVGEIVRSVPGMGYKVPSEVPMVRKNSARLDPEKAKTLYELGASVSDIAKAFGVGSSTVARRLKKAGTKKRRSGPGTKISFEGAVELLSVYKDVGWGEAEEEDKEKVVSRVLSVLRRAGFPKIPHMSEESSLSVLVKLSGKQFSLINRQIRPASPLGLNLCRPFFPNRYEVRYKGKRSAFESWFQDKVLKKAIQIQLSHGHPVTPDRVLKAICMITRTPTIFRPGVAKFICDTYGIKGLPYYDPCAGYGGRMLGALASGLRYIATDVDQETVDGNLKLAEALGSLDKVEVHKCPAENFDLNRQVGLVFTSPPYFDREQYSQSSDQSWRRYSSFDLWVRGFLKPVFQSAFKNLVVSGRMVINIADLKDKRGKVLPLVSETIAEALRCGFEHEDTIEMPLPSLNKRKNAHEPILVFVKTKEEPPEYVESAILREVGRSKVSEEEKSLPGSEYKIKRARITEEQAVEWHTERGMAAQEVADKFGVSKSTVLRRLASAKKKFK